MYSAVRVVGIPMPRERREHGDIYMRIYPNCLQCIAYRNQHHTRCVWNQQKTGNTIVLELYMYRMSGRGWVGEDQHAVPRRFAKPSVPSIGASCSVSTNEDAKKVGTSSAIRALAFDVNPYV